MKQNTGIFCNTLNQKPEPASEAQQSPKSHHPASQTRSSQHSQSRVHEHNKKATYNIPKLPTTTTTKHRSLRPGRSNDLPHPILEDSRPIPLSRSTSSTRLRCSWGQAAIAARITPTRKSRRGLCAGLAQDLRAVTAPRMPGARIGGRRQRHAVHDLRRGEDETQVLQDFDDVWWRVWQCSSSWSVLLSFRALTLCGLFSFLQPAGLIASLAIVIEPFRKPLFQHQASRRQRFLVRSADRAASLSRGVCVRRQRGDERVEDVLQEGHDGRAVGVVVWESDLEAQDGIRVRAWGRRKMSGWDSV